MDCKARTIWIAEAHRDDGRRFVMRADEKFTAFVELKSAIRVCAEFVLTGWPDFSRLGVVKRI
jgi:hypothetical protein